MLNATNAPCPTHRQVQGVAGSCSAPERPCAKQGARKRRQQALCPSQHGHKRKPALHARKWTGGCIGGDGAAAHAAAAGLSAAMGCFPAALCSAAVVSTRHRARLPSLRGGAGRGRGQGRCQPAGGARNDRGRHSQVALLCRPQVRGRSGRRRLGRGRSRARRRCGCGCGWRCLEQ